MNQIKYLEFQRLMKELQFVESDHLYQSEFIKISDIEFLKSVNSILGQFPALEELYKKKQEEFYKVSNEKISNKQENVEMEVEIVEKEIISRSDETRRLYRDIAKSTHPDKITNHKLNELYLEATGAYEQNDIITLYKVCSELNIEFELPDDYINKIIEKINDYKKRTQFLENTYTFKWLKCENPTEKNQIIIDFIRQRVL